MRGKGIRWRKTGQDGTGHMRTTDRTGHIGTEYVGP